MIADMHNNKNLDKIVTHLFIRGRKLNISFVFITQSYFKVAEIVRLNNKHLLMKIPIKRELKQTAYLSDIDYKDFKNLYKKCTAKLFLSFGW